MTSSYLKVKKLTLENQKKAKEQTCTNLISDNPPISSPHSSYVFFFVFFWLMVSFQLLDPLLLPFFNTWKTKSLSNKELLQLLMAVVDYVSCRTFANCHPFNVYVAITYAWNATNCYATVYMLLQRIFFTASQNF